MVRFCADKTGVVNWFMNRNYPKEVIPYLKQTRLYKGEPEDCNPFEDSDLAMFYFYELKWVQFNIEDKPSIEGDLRFYKDLIGEHFEANDGIPITMKALLLNRYLHWGGGWCPLEEEAEHFKTWYLGTPYYTYKKRKKPPIH